MSKRRRQRAVIVIPQAGGIGKRRRIGRRPTQAMQIVAAQNVRTGGFVGRELKFSDLEMTNQAFSGSWGTLEDSTADSLTGIGQGNGESQRLGRKYSIQSLHIRGFVEVAQVESQTAPLDDILARLVVVWDQQTNGAQLTATDVMDAGLTDDINSFRNLQHTGRFRVLKDKTFRIALNSQTNEGAINLFAAPKIEIPFKMNFDFKKNPIVVTTSGTANQITAVSDNSIHLIGIATSTRALINYQVRVRFTG